MFFRLITLEQNYILKRDSRQDFQTYLKGTYIDIYTLYIYVYGIPEENLGNLVFFKQ